MGKIEEISSKEGWFSQKRFAITTAGHTINYSNAYNVVVNSFLLKKFLLLISRSNADIGR